MRLPRTKASCLESLNQLNASLPKLEAEADSLRVTEATSEEVLAEAAALYDGWLTLATDKNRRIAEALIESARRGRR